MQHGSATNATRQRSTHNAAHLLVDAAPVEQLRRHVHRRPVLGGRVREVRARGVLDARDAKVGDERAAVSAEEHVLRLQVAVDDRGVEVGQALGDVARELRGWKG